MKKIFLIFLTCLILLSLSACDESKKIDDDDSEASLIFDLSQNKDKAESKEIDDMDSVESEEIDDVNSEASLNFDLSQYKEYGEWSEGLIWVIKETSDWDTEPYLSYAYLDRDGNVIYGWDRVGTYRDSNFNIGHYDRRARYPQNFKNGFALIYNYSNLDWGYVETTMIDKNGRVVAEFYIDAYERRNGEANMNYRDFNYKGYAFFIGKEYYASEEGMFFINDSGIHKFEHNENSIHSVVAMESIYIINDKYFHDPWSDQLFDINGNLVMDIGECSEIRPDYIKIINDKYIEGTFKGKDDKNYICVIDFNGNILKAPVLSSEYVRNEEELEKNGMYTILGVWVSSTFHRKDTLTISEKEVNWKTEWRTNAADEESVMHYNDLEFYDSDTKLPYEYKNGKITVTLLDGSKITFKREENKVYTPVEAPDTVELTTHAEYVAAELDTPVTVETYVQAKQSWWDNKATVYTQNEEGAYFLYEMACSEEDYAKLVPGTKIRVEGFKSQWAGEVEIMDGTFTIIEGEYIAPATDVTALLGTDELINHQNKFVSFDDMTVESIEYKNGEPGDDIYVIVSKDGASYSFCVEFYLTGTETEVYQTVGTLQAGDVVDIEGFLYWYEGVNTHITKITKT